MNLEELAPWLAAAVSIAGAVVAIFQAVQSKRQTNLQEQIQRDAAQPYVSGSLHELTKAVNALKPNA